MRTPSGEQWTIRYGDQVVTVVQVGGGLRSYDVAGRPVLHGYAPQQKADGGRGQLLMPWPNRLRDGRFSFDGHEQQVALSEPARSNASHGLVRWALWSRVEHTDAALTVAYSLLPQQGWDWPLELRVTYALGEHGLTVTPSATNVGERVAPFGFGAHPYLTTGEASVDELTLSVPGATVLSVDDRLIPTGRGAVPQPLDFRTPRRVGETRLDHAYTDLTASTRGTADGDRRVWQVSVSAGGATTTLWADAETYPFAQVFTGDSLAEPRRRRTGLAVEPMSCPANALQSGESLVRLDPGRTWTGAWGVAATSDAA